MKYPANAATEAERTFKYRCPNETCNNIFITPNMYQELTSSFQKKKINRMWSFFAYFILSRILLVAPFSVANDPPIYWRTVTPNWSQTQILSKFYLPLPKKKQLASTQWLKITALNLTLEQLNVMFTLRVKM